AGRVSGGLERRNVAFSTQHSAFTRTAQAALFICAQTFSPRRHGGTEKKNCEITLLPISELNSHLFLVRRQKPDLWAIQFVARATFGGCCQWVLDGVRETSSGLVSH